MRSCLSAFLFTLLLLGVVVGLGALITGQVEVGLCADQGLRVGLTLLGGGILMLAAILALLALINLELLEKSLSGMQILVTGSLVAILGMGVTSFLAYRGAGDACPRFDMVEDLKVFCQVETSGLNFSNLSVAYAAEDQPGLNSSALAWIKAPGNLILTASRVVVLGEQGQAIAWTETARKEWQPDSLEEINLVVCVGTPVKERIEVCQYGGGINLGRFRQTLPVRLVLAPTGETIAAGVLSADPAPCQPMGIQNLLRLTGKVSFAELKAWIEQALGESQETTTTSATPTISPATATPAQTATATLEPSPTPQISGEIKTGSRVRSGPGKENAVIAGLTTGEKVIVLWANPDRTWLFVEMPQGETGWIFAELVRLEMPLEEVPLQP